jgi:hypothetical protein
VMGCQNSELKKSKADLNNLKNSVKAAEKKIEDLKSRNRNLEKRLERVNSKNNNLHIQKRETDEWIGGIIKQIGPCVWAIGQFRKPVPEEIIPNGTPLDLIAKLNKKFKGEFDFEEGDHAFPGSYCPGMGHMQESIKNI